MDSLPDSGLHTVDTRLQVLDSKIIVNRSLIQDSNR